VQPVMSMYDGTHLVSLSIFLTWFFFLSGNIDHSLLQLLLNGPGRLAQGSVFKDCVPSPCEVLHHWIKALISSVISGSLMGETSFTGSYATELIRYYLCLAGVLSPTVTLYKWRILYPWIGSQM
jgi:hypothetical protein